MTAATSALPTPSPRAWGRTYSRLISAMRGGSSGFSADAAQHMIAALGQQQFAPRRRIDAGQRIQFLRKALRRQIDRQGGGIGAKQRRRRGQFGGAARRHDGEIVI